MQAVFELALVIAEIVSAHRGPAMRERFLHAWVHGHLDEAETIIQRLLAEPWQLKGHQETRLREFLELMPVSHGDAELEPTA